MKALKDKTSGLTKKDINTLRESNYKKKCRTCERKLLFSKYAYKKRTKGISINSECNECKYKKNIKNGYLRPQNYKEIYKAKRTSVEGWARQLLDASRSRSSNTKKESNIDINHILELIRPMKCQRTGIDLEIGIKPNNPFSPSLDRIDSLKGYVEGNIQIVCSMYNFCKNRFSDEQVKVFLTKQKYIDII